MKKYLSILFALLTTIFIVVMSVIPHHHHDEVVCIVMDECETFSEYGDAHASGNCCDSCNEYFSSCSKSGSISSLKNGQVTTDNKDQDLRILTLLAIMVSDYLAICENKSDSELNPRPASDYISVNPDRNLSLRAPPVA